MSIISILPEPLINKIAAGEVIERPVSIVREIMDNSIDAGAKKISVEVLHGGKKLIKVSDDGAGMGRDDASLCFERHSTSKIKSEDDLFNLTSLGFRGEALASIAAVSKVVLLTSTLDSRAGTKIEIGAGQKKHVSDAPPSPGTIIEVRDIFYNTPARRKFLKTVPTELAHIIGTVTQKALAYPEISFSLKHNESEVMATLPAKSIKERFIQLYTEEMYNEFFEIKKQGRGIELYGFFSAGGFTRSTRSLQFIFVNRRAIKNTTVNHAVYSAYRDLIPKDKHPAYFMFLDIDPGKVDVNVHPAKREIRFESPEEIHKLVFSAASEALRPGRDRIPGYIQPSRPAGFQKTQAGEDELSGGTVRETLESAFQSSGDFQTDFFTIKTAPALHRYFHIGEAFVAEVTNDGIKIIDRHAAHERVLYEKFLKKTSLEVKNLFLPIRIELPAKEFNIIKDYKNLFYDFGLDVEEFGANDVIVRALPEGLNKADLKGLFLDIASGIIEEETAGIRGESKEQRLLHSIAARLACHKSVRGKESLNDEELSQLLSDLEKAEMPEKCPHGRPTRIFLSLDDLRKMFKRK